MSVCSLAVRDPLQYHCLSETSEAHDAESNFCSSKAIGGGSLLLQETPTPDCRLREESQSHKSLSRPETATANFRLWERFAKEGNDFSPSSLC